MTPADKPDLPAPSHHHPMSGEPIWDEPTVRRLLADERRKTLDEAKAMFDGMDYVASSTAIQRLIDRKEPT